MTEDKTPSEATQRMAKTLGAEWVPNGRAKPEASGDLVTWLRMTGMRHVDRETRERLDDVANELQSLRSALEVAEEALDQLLDDMGADGLCVCQQAKDEAIAARNVARAALNGTTVDDGGSNERD